jgi:hypothetical protein
VEFGYHLGEEREPLVRVAMSWEHAAAVVALLQRQIAEYEKRVGTLPNLDRIKDDYGDREPA